MEVFFGASALFPDSSADCVPAGVRGKAIKLSRWDVYWENGPSIAFAGPGRGFSLKTDTSISVNFDMIALVDGTDGAVGMHFVD